MSNEGVCKSFTESKGWGFVIHDGQDVFFHINDCVQGMPQAGDHLTFDLEPSSQTEGKMVAKNISGGTGGGSCEGTVKSFSDMTGYGFIEYDGQEVFVHGKDVVGGSLKKGNKVFFEVEPNPNKHGQLCAKNVKGGSGSAKGKGMSKGDFAPMMEMMAMMMKGMSRQGPYGGGSKGKGKNGAGPAGKGPKIYSLPWSDSSGF
eukprot:TRINITY_DN13614_c0_g2_i1.p1 TRINITY_DN13614_c0_g2~~TRINITY_DN13614_c0_g2_i1.p1  ORF type:complete len:221 (-),score=50.20 TRINITY_DN13614_c0_g2_i1:128-733(-)